MLAAACALSRKSSSPMASRTTSSGSRTFGRFDGIREPGAGGAGNSAMVLARGRIGGRLAFFFANAPTVSERRGAQTFARARRQTLDRGRGCLGFGAGLGLHVSNAGREGVGVDTARALLRGKRRDDVVTDLVDAFVTTAERLPGADVAALGLPIASRRRHAHHCARGLDRRDSRRRDRGRGGGRHRRIRARARRGRAHGERGARRLRGSHGRSSCRPSFSASATREREHRKDDENDGFRCDRAHAGTSCTPRSINA